MLKLEKGMTLLALIITILVILILAGVTLGIATNKKDFYQENNEELVNSLNVDE